MPFNRTGHPLKGLPILPGALLYIESSESSHGPESPGNPGSLKPTVIPSTPEHALGAPRRTCFQIGHT